MYLLIFKRYLNSGVKEFVKNRQITQCFDNIFNLKVNLYD